LEYQKKLRNQIIPLIGETTSLKELEWANGGRKLVMDAVVEIGGGGKHDLANRCQNLMRQVFNFSISRGWMSEGRNPADKMKGDESPEPSNNHHPSIKWEEVPALLKEVNLNRCNTHIQSVLATKMMLMTFLRAGALTRLEWDWFESQFPNTITIPGTTAGLKRKHGKNDDIPHHVPITSEMREVFDVLRQFSGDSKYVFQPMRDSRFPHLDPSAINNNLRNLGYKDKLRAHGWRSTALTTGIDVLKCESDVIRKQMGHLPEGKVSQAYDNSLRLEERRVFMEKWCQLLVESGMKV
jgi:integrase